MPKHFERERLTWRIVVQLNVIGYAHDSRTPSVAYRPCCRSIKTILDALSEEYQPDVQATTPPDTKSDCPLRTLRRLQLSLSPLFFIESDLLKLLAPGYPDCRQMTVRTTWKKLLQDKIAQPPTSHGLPAEGEHVPIRRRGSRGQILPNVYDPTSVLVAQREDIISLWRNPEFQKILMSRRPWLRGSSGLCVISRPLLQFYN